MPEAVVLEAPELIEPHFGKDRNLLECLGHALGSKPQL